eukprot:TRINITY_DN36378_c0_g1_i1.p1 TRINITY_DN36378_c0_g1~~TRINITY_DN36378_c0_g1_i1.p1  ORF type:complete len:310 (-),score=57.01 TRINITY_DN36378_c0_g1_i1:42-971(-)
MASHGQATRIADEPIVSKTGGAVNIERKVQDDHPETVRSQNDAPHPHPTMGEKIKHGLRAIGIGKDDPPQGVVDPHPEVTVESGSGMDGLPWSEKAKVGMHSALGNPKAMQKDESEVPVTVHSTIDKPNAPHAEEHSTPHAAPTMKEKIKHGLRSIGIGKDDPPEGVVDPHPEVTVESGSGMDGVSWSEKAKIGMHSAFGKPKAMQKAEHEDSPELLAKIEEAHAKAVAEEEGRAFDEPIEAQPSSNVEKLSPFSGPVKGDPVGPRLGSVEPRTGGVPASRVQAPGFLGRAKEEVEAIGGAVKSIFTGK